MFSLGPRNGGGQVVHEQVNLGNQDDGKGGVQGLERVGEQAGREGQKPQFSQAVEPQVDAEHDQRQRH